ncbi:Cyclic di-GMP phosphodiesterase response regulator RpfG [Gemmata obscuriglobus]|uniref:HDIG domain-containing protein n=1 Tax=Gemmata obscuriglobus TaxID=114 RepID=A0A2Z3HC05_9BACT|nr:HD domain-containing phosphohydrolase [Gemmata obscuriglobus]AWM41087.1 HDIG domain-containing protein [Gemmata obscuriglobus]QEG25579.1 Cyclic di-GMP phosphodiesterase response regulator RpfG [Gemmata obscuriglobus]VTR99007.1 two-component response regulator variant : Response regulator receiver modulated metal dependent phosphohydrolase OS=Desulfomicrobium baculatum (strain DSM 4028 / VKM B-1378) GN=Dbac_0387 PE=4 SV=1: FHA: GAF_3: HD [Gemmata obscuriglobus UQM 2246]
MKRPLRLRGLSGEIKGQVWESDTQLRAGRIGTLEIVLDDSSVSRRHAEVLHGDDGWYVRDVGSTNGTYVNGVRIGPGEQPLKSRDIVQFGKVAVIVELTDGVEGPPSNQHVVAAAVSSFDEGIRRLAYDRNHMPRAGEQMLALLRAGHHFVNTQSEDQLLDAVLNDAVSVLEAQRGAIVLAESDGPEPKMRLRALAVGQGEPPGRFHYSKKLTQRCFASGVSLLYSTLTGDEESKVTQSIADGAMASVLCVLLRTPRKRLGVLHLDRSFWQNPFTEDDLHLADALAAHVSAAIESAQLLRRQKEQFQKTVTVLAQAVELRDDYTGNHTQRVTRYATMLGEKLGLPEDQIELIRIGGPLHDIGKIGIDDAILRKPGRLTGDEYELMKKHTTKGAEILSSIPEMGPIIPIVRSHHERWDGGGYPDGLAGEGIPLLARVVAVADAFDAMTSNRPYHENKKGKPPSWAFGEVERQAGKQFDPTAAAAFVSIRDDIVRAMGELIPGSEVETPEPVTVTGFIHDPRG